MRPARVTLLSMLLVGGIQPYPAEPTVNQIVASAETDCLSHDDPRLGRLGLGMEGRHLSGCRSAYVPLTREAMIGTSALFSGLEFRSSTLGQSGTPEVKLKFGITRDLLSGSFANVKATIDGSIARILGPSGPGFDQRLHVSLEKSFGSHWQTGLEGRVGALGGLGLSQLTERTGLVLVRVRYSQPMPSGSEHSAELKLWAESWQSPAAQVSTRKTHADLRYEYRMNPNVLSASLGYTGFHPSNPDGNEIRAELRVTRQF